MNSESSDSSVNWPIVRRCNRQTGSYVWQDWYNKDQGSRLCTSLCELIATYFNVIIPTIIESNYNVDIMIKIVTLDVVPVAVPITLLTFYALATRWLKEQRSILDNARAWWLFKQWTSSEDFHYTPLNNVFLLDGLHHRNVFSKKMQCVSEKMLLFDSCWL